MQPNNFNHLAFSSAFIPPHPIRPPISLSHVGVGDVIHDHNQLSPLELNNPLQGLSSNEYDQLLTYIGLQQQNLVNGTNVNNNINNNVRQETQPERPHEPTTCVVCGNNENVSIGPHEARTCHVCRKFHYERRSGRLPVPTVCKSGTYDCKIDNHRGKCSYCRFKKLISIGFDDPSNGIHLIKPQADTKPKPRKLVKNRVVPVYIADASTQTQQQDHEPQISTQINETVLGDDPINETSTNEIHTNTTRPIEVPKESTEPEPPYSASVGQMSAGEEQLSHARTCDEAAPGSGSEPTVVARAKKGRGRPRKRSSIGTAEICQICLILGDQALKFKGVIVCKSCKEFVYGCIDLDPGRRSELGKCELGSCGQVECRACRWNKFASLATGDPFKEYGPKKVPPSKPDGTNKWFYQDVSRATFNAGAKRTMQLILSRAVADNHTVPQDLKLLSRDLHSDIDQAVRNTGLAYRFHTSRIKREEPELDGARLTRSGALLQAPILDLMIVLNPATWPMPRSL